MTLRPRVDLSQKTKSPATEHDALDAMGRPFVYTLQQLRYFVDTARHGSIAAAAQTLHVSQPSVSSAISKLEQQFDMQLFIRHHAHGVSLTPSGERLVVAAERLLRHAWELQNNALAAHTRMAGQIEVGCFVTIAAAVMPRLITGFMAAYPDVCIHLHEGDEDQIIQGLKTGRLELALVYDVSLGEELTFQKLVETQPYVLLPDGHRLTRKKQIDLTDLKDEPFILLDIPPSRDYFPGLFRSVGLEPRIVLRSPSIEMVRGMVARGAGYSILVTRPYSDYTYDGGSIVARPLRDTIYPGWIGIARLARHRPTQLMEEFVNFSHRLFQSAPADRA